MNIIKPNTLSGHTPAAPPLVGIGWGPNLVLSPLKPIYGMIGSDENPYNCVGCE